MNEAIATPAQLFELGRLIVSGRIELGCLKKDIVQDVIKNPVEFSRQFTHFLQNGGRCDQSAIISDFSTASLEPDFSIKLGLKRSGTEYLAALEALGRVDEKVKLIISHPDFVVADNEEDCDLVILSPVDLGLQACYCVHGRSVSWQTLFVRAQDLGLELCSPEVGPALLLADVGDLSSCRIAMDPFPLSDDHSMMFVFSPSDGGGNLRARKTSLHDEAYMRTIFRFRRPQN